MNILRRPGKEAVELAGEDLTTWHRCSHPRAVRRRSALTCAAHRSQRGRSGVPHGESRPRCSPVDIVPRLARSQRLADIGARRELGDRSRFHSPISPRCRPPRSPEPTYPLCCFGRRSPPRRSGTRRRLRSSAPGPSSRSKRPVASTTPLTVLRGSLAMRSSTSRASSVSETVRHFAAQMVAKSYLRARFDS